MHYLQGRKLPGLIIGKVHSMRPRRSLGQFLPGFNRCRVAYLQGRLKTKLAIGKVHSMWACRSLGQL